MRSTTMRVFLASALIFITFFCQAAYSQDNQINKYAQETVDKYLKGMTIFELSEGKQIVTVTSWPQWGHQPVLLKYETVFEGMFGTDIPSIKGYKRLIDAQVKSEAGTPLTKRVLLIAYPDAKDKKWRILIFSTGTDVERSIAYGEKEIGNIRNTKPDQFKYRFLALWYAAAGRLNDSYRTYRKAADLNRRNPDDSTAQSDFDIHVETLRQIMGI